MYNLFLFCVIFDNSKADLYIPKIYPESWARCEANWDHLDFTICNKIST